MLRRERFLATILGKPVDRPASWLGLPTAEALPALLRHFLAADMAELKQMIDDDVYPVEMPYQAPGSQAIYTALNFRKTSGPNDDSSRTLTAPGFFEDMEDAEEVSSFAWPDPEKHISMEKCGELVDAIPQDYARLGVIWSAHFQDSCAAFGMETALVNMMTRPELYQVVDQRIVDFYLQANKVFYEATQGKLDAVLIGNDFGSQRGLMLSPELIREFVIPGTRRLIDQAKAYGLKVIYHSCGSIEPVIDDLIMAGADVIHPIQALAKDMGLDLLKQRYGGKTAFCGGIDAQNLLVSGAPEQVYEQVIALRKIMPTGLVFSPSHEAILPDIAPANIEALFKAVHAVI